MKRFKYAILIRSSVQTTEEILNVYGDDGFRIVGISKNQIFMEKELGELVPMFNHEHGLLTNVQRMQMEEMTNGD